MINIRVINCWVILPSLIVNYPFRDKKCRDIIWHFLLPMQRNAGEDDKIRVRMITLDDYEEVIDFEGRTLATNDFAVLYGVSLTPAQLFTQLKASHALLPF